MRQDRSLAQTESCRGLAGGLGPQPGGCQARGSCLPGKRWLRPRRLGSGCEDLPPPRTSRTSLGPLPPLRRTLSEEAHRQSPSVGFPWGKGGGGFPLLRRARSRPGFIGARGRGSAPWPGQPGALRGPSRLRKFVTRVGGLGQRQTERSVTVGFRLSGPRERGREREREVPSSFPYTSPPPLPPLPHLFFPPLPHLPHLPGYPSP